MNTPKEQSWRDILCYYGHGNFDPPVITVGERDYDLHEVTFYNPNYLDQTPPYVLIKIAGEKVALAGDDAIEFNRLFNERQKYGVRDAQSDVSKD